MRLFVELHTGSTVDPVLAPNNMSLTQIHEVLDEEWPKYRAAKVPNSSFVDWLIDNTEWGFTHPATSSCRWNAHGDQFKGERPMVASHAERISRAIEWMGEAHDDLLALTNHFTGLKDNPEEMRALAILASMLENTLTHTRGVQRRMGERA